MSAALTAAGVTQADFPVAGFNGVPAGDDRLAEIRKELDDLLKRKGPLARAYWGTPKSLGSSSAKAKVNRLHAALRVLDDRLSSLLIETVELPAATPEGKRTKALILMQQLAELNMRNGRLDPEDVTITATLSLCADILSRGMV